MRQREQNREAARAKATAEATALQAQVQTGFGPPPGKLFGVDEAAMIVMGPKGAIGTTTLLVRTLAILTAPGQHDPESLLAAGWQDIEHLTAGLDAFAAKLATIGLRMDRRKTGLRITKAKPDSSSV